MSMKKIGAAAIAISVCASLCAAVPEVAGVTMTQASDRLVTIAYTLLDAPAVVTVDIQTNVTSGTWASIGGANIQQLTGDVWKRVEAGNHTIAWRPDFSWPDHKVADGGARAVVTAWALDNTPDYMVVDISSAAQPNSQTYYPAVEFLPGGILSNAAYRTTKMLMRKVMAKNVEWTMGSVNETGRQSNERTHSVTLTNNYYIGVFPVTQTQWSQVQTLVSNPSFYTYEGDKAMRPVEQVSFNAIRNSTNKTADTAYDWPADPNPKSFLGQLNARTGLRFDLPSEAQWEFAARAGHGEGCYGDGSSILGKDTDSNLDLLGRYAYNGGKIPTAAGGLADALATSGATNGTAIVGSYAPNSWGIYDMHGNVFEWCLDWYVDNINANNGKLNIDPAAPEYALTGEKGSGKVIRGGSCNNQASQNRPSFRRTNGQAPSFSWSNIGFRVVCVAGLR